MIRFSSINRANSGNHNPNYQRHHLIPRQAVTEPDLRDVFEILSKDGFDLDDFERNGILLPCCEEEAKRIGRPLHRGPHPRYNEIIIEYMLHFSKLGNRMNRADCRQRFIRHRVSLLQGGLRFGLQRNVFSELKIHSRNPAKTEAAFFQIDSRIDQIYRDNKPSPRRRSYFTLASSIDRSCYIAEL